MVKYALIGYSNTLSKNILELLALRGVSKKDVAVFEDKVHGAPKVSFGDEDLIVLPLTDLKPQDFDLVILTGKSPVAFHHVQKYADEEIKVIDASFAFGGGEEVPMIVGGVNDSKLDTASNFITVPHPYVVQLLGALAGVTNKYTIKNIRLSAYIAADLEEQDGMSELYNRTRRILMHDTIQANEGLFHKNLAFNVIPQAGSFIGEETTGEWIFNAHCKQVLGGDVKVHANCALVSAFVGMGMYANIETIEDIDASDVEADIKKTKGILFLDKQEDGGYFSLTDAQGENSIFISRLRQDMTVENGISLWIAGDTYKIAAQNILAIAKQFLKRG
ncbi:MAG: hypothetical protein MJ210_03020 [Alphaproteobacteria bacterium]|nr:hypothetical protein [Alphaproteobacteria bacterium]